MTRREIVDQIWVAIGKPTEYDPDPASLTYDTSLNGGPFLSFVANEGQRQVAKWKAKESGRPIRINDLFSTFHYSSYITTDVILAVNNTTDPYYVTLTTSNATSDDYYEGWVLEITSGDADGEVRYIYDYSAASRTCYLNTEFDTTPAVGDTVKLFKRFELLLPSGDPFGGAHPTLPATSTASRNTGNLLEILSIVDVTNGKELEGTTKIEKFASNLTVVGTPSYWYRYGNAIYYDKNVDETLKYRVEYYRTPMDMDADASTPDIPEIWHMAIVLWGIHYMMKRKIEPSLAYTAKLDFEDEMRRTVSEFEVRKERIDTGGRVVYEKE